MIGNGPENGMGGHQEREPTKSESLSRRFLLELIDDAEYAWENVRMSDVVNNLQAMIVAGGLAAANLVPSEGRAEAYNEEARAAQNAFEDIDRGGSRKRERKINELETEVEDINIEITKARSRYDEQIHDINMTQGSLDQEISELQSQSPVEIARAETARDKREISRMYNSQIDALSGKKSLVQSLSPEERKNRTAELEAEKEKALNPLLDDKKKLETKLKRVESKDRILKTVGNSLDLMVRVSRDIETYERRSGR